MRWPFIEKRLKVRVFERPTKTLVTRRGFVRVTRVKGLEQCCALKQSHPMRKSFCALMRCPEKKWPR